MISEKIIYNTFLKISRSKSGLPYRLRKQWDDFETSDAYPYVLKLKNFFNRNTSVDLTDFFNAPYTVYPGESGFDLKFYSTQNAIKVYSLAMKRNLFLSPDDKYHLGQIVRGLKFIQKFCQENSLKINEYIKFKNGIQNAFITHLKERKVSIYNLFAFNDFDLCLKQHDPDLLRFTLGDLYDSLPIFRTKYMSSKSAKYLATAGLEKIKKNLS